METFGDTYRRFVIRARFRYRGVPPREEWDMLSDLERKVAQSLVEEFGEEAFQGSVLAQQAAMDRAFAVLLTNVFQSFPDAPLSPDRIESVEQTTRQAMASFSVRAEELLRGGATQGTRRALHGHQNALNRISAQAGIDISDDFILQLMDRVRGRADRRRAEIDVSTLRLMRDNVTVANDQTISWIRGRQGRPGREAARQMLRRFSEGANFERIQGALEDLGPRGQSVRRAIERAGRAAEDLEDEASNLYVNAKRVLVHEQNVAFHEADVLANEESPAVRTVHWRTSARHASLQSSPDRCDLCEDGNVHGFGPGFFHPGSAPSLMHPFCNCGIFPQTLDPDEWGEMNYSEDQVPNRKPRTMPINEVGQILRANLTAASGPVTQNKIQRAWRTYNRKVQVAYDAFIDF